MTSLLHTLLLVPILATPFDQGVATELRYSGSLTPKGRNATGTAVKQFNIYCLVSKSEGGLRNIVTLVDERGGGGWAWPERVGQVSLDAANKPTGKFQIRVLHEHDGNLYPLDLRQPIFEFGDKIKEGESWTEGKYEYEVGKTRKVNGYDCRQVDVSTNFGRQQVLAVEPSSLFVVSTQQKVFMGQGEEFELKMDLESAKPVDEKQLALLSKPIDTLLKLKSGLNRKDDETRPELDEQQLAAAAKVIEQLEQQAEDTPFSRLASVISRDVKTQAQRVGDVSQLSKKFTGQAAPEFMLKSIDRMAIDAKESKDKVVVLHFWEYQGEPLVEPYGQVGYLDYLNSRRRKLGVQVYGVAVDTRLGDAGGSSDALRSIRKLRSFMNLSFPIAGDDGSLLQKFGDPRKLGAKLPLWVVIDPDGKVVHYKVGYYSINPDEGLRELDDVIVELIKNQRDKG